MIRETRHTKNDLESCGPRRVRGTFAGKKALPNLPWAKFKEISQKPDRRREIRFSCPTLANKNAHWHEIDGYVSQASEVLNSDLVDHPSGSLHLGRVSRTLIKF